MRKTVVAIVIGLVLISVNLYAAGDLVVNGTLGVGTSTTSAKVDVVASEANALELTASKTTSIFLKGIELGVSDNEINSQKSSTGINVRLDHNGSYNLGNSGASGGTFLVRLLNGGNAQAVSISGQNNAVSFQNSGNYTIAEVVGTSYTLQNGGASTGNVTVSTMAGFRVGSSFGNASGTYNITNLYGGVIRNLGSTLIEAGTRTNIGGLKIDKQTGGTKNYGIVLDGDGAGADIVLGANQATSIYASGGEIFVKDGASNVTQISPHDPATGEWRFYSQNIKTGRVVEIHMEKLVKAVEKLTGEKFMIETIAGQ